MSSDFSKSISINSAERLLRARRKKRAAAARQSRVDDDGTPGSGVVDYSEISLEERKQRREALRRQRDERVSKLKRSRRGTLSFTQHFSSLRSNMKLRSTNLRSELSNASLQSDMGDVSRNDTAEGSLASKTSSTPSSRSESAIAPAATRVQDLARVPATIVEDTEDVIGCESDMDSAREQGVATMAARRAMSSWGSSGSRASVTPRGSIYGTRSSRSSLTGDGSGAVTTSGLVEFLAAELRERDADLALAAQLGGQVTAEFEKLQDDYEEALVDLRDTHAKTNS